MKFGERLKQGRIKANLTQEEVIRQIGVTRQSLSNWENDRTYPDLASVVRLSDLYHIPLDDLLRDDMELRHQMEAQRKRCKTWIFALLDFSLLLLISVIPLKWLGNSGVGFVFSGLGLMLCFLAHYLLVRFLGTDWRLMGLRCLGMFIFWAGFLLWHSNRDIGILLILIGDIPEVYVARRLQLIEKEFRHLSFFTGVVITLVILFCFFPFAEDAERRGDFAANNPFSGQMYRVAEVVQGSGEDLPLIHMRDNQ